MFVLAVSLACLSTSFPTAYVGSICLVLTHAFLSRLTKKEAHCTIRLRYEVGRAVPLESVPTGKELLSVDAVVLGKSPPFSWEAVSIQVGKLLLPTHAFTGEHLRRVFH